MALVALTRIPVRPGGSIVAAFWEPGDVIPDDAPVDRERLIRVGAAEEATSGPAKPTAKGSKAAIAAAKAEERPLSDDELAALTDKDLATAVAFTKAVFSDAEPPAEDADRDTLIAWVAARRDEHQAPPESGE